MGFFGSRSFVRLKNDENSSGFVTFGNDVLEKEKALEIVDMVIGQFHKKGLRHFSLENIINIESKRGRYLVELQLFDGDTKKSVRFSEYLYLPKGSSADIKQALESSSLPNYLYLTNTGVFYKTLGLQQAADSITDPNAIVVILDLHLDIPAYFVDDIRKHTIQGLQFYSPVLMRMECGTNAAVDMGSYWEFHGYGLVGIYKNDWDKFGGMNVEEFKYKWGGEDIEMTDRILMEGFESEQGILTGLLDGAGWEIDVRCKAGLEKKALFGYWSSFIPDSASGSTWSLFTTILRDPSPKARAAGVAVISELLDHSRPFLAVAEDRCFKNLVE
ncbi:hypothetical protein QZH41_006911 [Actinostola sp. cb2023]|nr:hypothetical protein QZH41_006911 [Actinostola sp. cb2023]